MHCQPEYRKVTLQIPEPAYPSSMGKDKTPITKEAAQRIQSHADRTGTNQDFKSRAQSSADKKK